VEHAHALRLPKEGFESLTDAILVLRCDGTVMDANSNAEDVFGYSSEELSKLSVQALLPELTGNLLELRDRPEPRFTREQIEPRLIKVGVRKDLSEFPANIDIRLKRLNGERLFAIAVRDMSEETRPANTLEERGTRHPKDDHAASGESHIIGQSQAIMHVLEQASLVAETDATVLILGETGTGKELIARAIHRRSVRSNHPMVTLNCGSIPDELLESELFGCEKGAFTGAVSQRAGKLELTHNGTLFLGEIGELSLRLQPKILRALQEKEIDRLGGSRTIRVDFRLIVATHCDLAQMVKGGTFRSDLYYRLKVFPILVPPLRERQEDIPELVSFFVAKHARRMNKTIRTVPTDVIAALKRWQWPGNIRELEHFVERSVILSKGATLQVPLGELVELSSDPPAEDTKREEDERKRILHVLKQAGSVIGGPTGAAARLGVKRTTLNSKIKRLGIERREYLA
jgi:PAS domain S-box-containing protein